MMKLVLFRKASFNMNLRRCHLVEKVCFLFIIIILNFVKIYYFDEFRC